MRVPRAADADHFSHTARLEVADDRRPARDFTSLLFFLFRSLTKTPGPRRVSPFFLHFQLASESIKTNAALRPRTRPEGSGVFRMLVRIIRQNQISGCALRRRVPALAVTVPDPAPRSEKALFKA